MTNILLIGVFEGLFLAMLLFTKKRKTISDKILSLFFIVFSLNIGLSYIDAYNRNHGFLYPIFIFTAAPFLLLHGPLLWLYIKSLTDQFFKLKPVYLLNLIPFAAMVIHHTVAFYILPASEKIQIVQTESFKHDLAYYVFVLSIAVSPVIYFYFALRSINRYKLKIESYYSQKTGIDLKWLKVIVGSWLFMQLIVNAFFIADLFVPVASFGVMQFFSFVTGAIYVVFIGFYGLKQENVFLTHTIQINLEKEAGNQLKNNYEKPVTAAENEFIKQLLNHMSEHKPYLEPEITLKILSTQLKVSAEFLSEIINTDFNKNFFDFINYYRIEEFKSQIKNEKNKKLTIIGIAYDCGFNSKATFNRVFKRSTGLTPSEYISTSQ